MFGSRSRSSGWPKPQETLLGRRKRSAGFVINDLDASSRLVKPKTEPGLLPVKQKHLAMAADDETALTWSRDNYVREEMERQRRALEEIAARLRGREEGGVVVRDDNNEEASGPSNPVLHGDQRQGAARTAAERAATATTTTTTPISTSSSACRRRRRRAAAAGGGDVV
ncbi:SEC12-like protein 2 [Hordeum vulgare]|nr:SEC12-like protein 2 [Hordeum vulgare]